VYWSGRSPGGQVQVELTLPGRQPLVRRGLERLQLSVIMRRAKMLDAPRATPGDVHDLHRDRLEAVFTVRTYAAPRDYEPLLVRKSTGLHPQNLQATALRPSEPRPGDKSQVRASAKRTTIWPGAVQPN